MKVSSGARLGCMKSFRPSAPAVWARSGARGTRRSRREVAIKTLPDACEGSPTASRGWSARRRLLASLNHPNIAVIHGLESGRHAVPGARARRRRDPRTAIAARALTGPGGAEAGGADRRSPRGGAREGIVHRDLKPANVIITPEGRAKVLDFGIAKASRPASDVAVDGDRDRDPPGHRRRHAGLHEPRTGPRRKRGVPESDIWSFGVVLYELLTGRSPFRQKTAAETLAKLLEVPPTLRAARRRRRGMCRHSSAAASSGIGDTGGSTWATCGWKSRMRCAARVAPRPRGDARAGEQDTRAVGRRRAGGGCARGAPRLVPCRPFAVRRACGAGSSVDFVFRAAARPAGRQPSCGPVPGWIAHRLRVACSRPCQADGQQGRDGRLRPGEQPGLFT